jgi:hypothetical protein
VANLGQRCAGLRRDLSSGLMRQYAGQGKNRACGDSGSLCPMPTVNLLRCTFLAALPMCILFLALLLSYVM